MQDSELVTIVVPVYNVESYLPRCLESIFAQTHQRIDVILVDDGSTDDSGKICDEAAFSDDRFTVIHKTNGGLSDARNVGLDMARGTWVFFLDSDDFISPYCIETMLNAALTSGAQIVECAFDSVEDSATVVWSTPTGEYEAFRQPKALERFLDYNGTSVMAWNKLYRTALFEGVRFPIGKLNEDEFTTPYLVERVSSYASLKDSLYAYVQREGSIMHSSFSEKKLDGLEALSKRLVHFSVLGNGRIDAINAYHLLARCRALESKYRGELGEYSHSISAAAEIALQVRVAPRFGLSLFLKTMLMRRFPSVALRLRGGAR